MGLGRIARKYQHLKGGQKSEKKCQRNKSSEVMEVHSKVKFKECVAGSVRFSPHRDVKVHRRRHSVSLAVPVSVVLGSESLGLKREGK